MPPLAPVGLILLSQKPLDALAPLASIVAVDFGTTNTVACMDDNQPITFRSRVSIGDLQA